MRAGGKLIIWSCMALCAEIYSIHRTSGRCAGTVSHSLSVNLAMTYLAVSKTNLVWSGWMAVLHSGNSPGQGDLWKLREDARGVRAFSRHRPSRPDACLRRQAKRILFCFDRQTEHGH